eukprot:1548911-Rhodomonas_salina.1
MKAFRTMINSQPEHTAVIYHRSHIDRVSNRRSLRCDGSLAAAQWFTEVVELRLDLDHVRVTVRESILNCHLYLRGR